jgi:small GTP-binding protein
VTQERTCAILLTPAGAAAIAVVRLVGPEVGKFLESHFDKPAEFGRPVHGALRDNDEIIDDPVVVVDPDGRYADISLHGGAWVVRAVLELARREGFELEEGDAGVAAARAIDADNELEAEILSHVPLAVTELALQSLLAQEPAWRALQTRGASSEELGRLLEDRSLHWLLHPPRVSIVGAANVGKSTLANQLFAQERSITADIPGTTRDWVGEIANLDGLAVQLIDTPGLRETDDPIEAAAIRHSAGQIRAADLILLVLDASRELQPDQAPLIERFAGAILVMNKCDLLRRLHVTQLGTIQTVATSGKGVEELIKQILAQFGNPQDNVDRPRCWTERQRKALSRGQIPW